jgi:hypothetical protein
MMNPEITAVTARTADICATYLVGGFSGRREVGTRRYTQPLDIFRTKYQGPLVKMCASAEAGDSNAISALSKVITTELRRARWFRFDGKVYTFKINSFDDDAMAYLMVEVMAQVNEK